jgi:hypothetical protein
MGRRYAVSATSYVGPDDVASGNGFFWGVRAVNAAYAGGPSLDLHDDSTGTFVQTINTLANGAFDSATAATVIAGGAAHVGKIYDQGPNAVHLTQATNATRPILALNGSMGYGLQYDRGIGEQNLINLSLTFTGPFSVSTVVKCTVAQFSPCGQYGTSSGAALCFWNQLSGQGDIDIGSGVGRFDNNYLNTNLNMQNIYNSANSFVYLNGSPGIAISAPSGGPTSAVFALGDDGTGSNSFNGFIHEMGIWPTVVFGTSVGQQANLLDINQSAYYGTH